jgi:sigma-E factor negative regulatory protein RseC
MNMHSEEFYEEGIVLQASTGEALVAIGASDHCPECTAKLLCHPGVQDKHCLKVADPLGIRPGDRVRMVVYGSSLVKATFLIYGMPLVLLLVGVIVGYLYFGEIAAGFFGLGLPALFMLGLWAYTRWIPVRPLLTPRIVAVLEHSDLEGLQ